MLAKGNSADKTTPSSIPLSRPESSFQALKVPSLETSQRSQAWLGKHRGTNANLWLKRVRILLWNSVWSHELRHLGAMLMLVWRKLFLPSFA